MSAVSVPNDWIAPKWLETFNRRELQWLAERLDAANRELRIVNRRLTRKINETQESIWNGPSTAPASTPGPST